MVCRYILFLVYLFIIGIWTNVSDIFLKWFMMSGILCLSGVLSLICYSWYFCIFVLPICILIPSGQSVNQAFVCAGAFSGISSQVLSKCWNLCILEVPPPKTGWPVLVPILEVVPEMHLSDLIYRPELLSDFYFKHKKQKLSTNQIFLT
jgi:hypothetical protein